MTGGKIQIRHEQSRLRAVRQVAELAGRMLREAIHDAEHPDPSRFAYELVGALEEGYGGFTPWGADPNLRSGLEEIVRAILERDIENTWGGAE